MNLASTNGSTVLSQLSHRLRERADRMRLTARIYDACGEGISDELMAEMADLMAVSEAFDRIVIEGQIAKKRGNQPSPLARLVAETVRSSLIGARASTVEERV